jgi:hypothetical protein
VRNFSSLGGDDWIHYAVIDSKSPIEITVQTSAFFWREEAAHKEIGKIVFRKTAPIGAK